jgi:hypothetical protein
VGVDAGFIEDVVDFKSGIAVAEEEDIAVDAEAVGVVHGVGHHEAVVFIVGREFDDVEAVDAGVAVSAGDAAAEGDIGVAVGDDHGVAAGGMGEAGDVFGHGRHFQVKDKHAGSGAEEHVTAENKHGFHLPADVLFTDGGWGGRGFHVEHVKGAVVDSIEIVAVQSEAGHGAPHTK